MNPPITKHKFSPRISTWISKEPATANQLQSAFKLKYGNYGCRCCHCCCLYWFWKSRWVCLVKAEGFICWMLPWGLWSVQEPAVVTWESGEGMNKWTMMYKRSMQDSKAATLFEKWGNATEAKGAVTAYNDAKRVAKHAAWLANSGANSEDKEEITTVSPKSGVFRIVKQIDHTNQNVIDENCVWKVAWLVAHLAS